jgi:hypothetical protein
MQRQHERTVSGLREYQYKPLDPSKHEKRLLRLELGEPEQIVQCSIYHVSLDDKPQYTALSYVWGDSNDRRTIMLEDVPFKVTLSLEAAL